MTANAAHQHFKLHRPTGTELVALAFAIALLTLGVLTLVGVGHGGAGLAAVVTALGAVLILGLGLGERAEDIPLFIDDLGPNTPSVTMGRI